MRQVIDVFKRNDMEKRLKVLKLEIDYELTTLHDAMKDDDVEQIKKSKKMLEQYRKELMRLEG